MGEEINHGSYDMKFIKPFISNNIKCHKKKMKRRDGERGRVNFLKVKYFEQHNRIKGTSCDTKVVFNKKKREHLPHDS